MRRRAACGTPHPKCQDSSIEVRLLELDSDNRGALPRQGDGTSQPPVLPCELGRFSFRELGGVLQLSEP
jgi:hypothetical protein